MKKFLTTIFVILLVAVIAIFGYGYLSNGKQASPETLDIVEKVKDVPLTTTDGSEMSIDDIISTDSDGKLQVDTQALQNISSDSLQAVRTDILQGLGIHLQFTIRIRADDVINRHLRPICGGQWYIFDFFHNIQCFW